MKKEILQKKHDERVAETKRRLEIKEGTLREKMMELFFAEVALMTYIEKMQLCTQIMAMKKPEKVNEVSEGRIIES